VEHYRIEQVIDPTVWRSFVEQHPQGNIFHTPELFEVFSQARGHSTSTWAALDSSGEILALLLPVQITLFHGPLLRLLRPLSSRAVAFGSVLCAPNTQGQAVLGELLKAYNRKMKNGPLFTEFRNLSDLREIHPVLGQNGFAYEDHLNFLIDLDRPVPGIWHEVNASARRNIKKAQRSGVLIEELIRPEEIPGAYAVLKEVYKRIQVPLPDISLFQAAFTNLHPKGMLKILLARVEGKIVGVLCLLLYKGTIYYWYTGTLREYASYRTADLLVWHILELGSCSGYKLFDFGGGGKPNKPYGVRDFKAKYGGTMVNFGRNINIHSPLRLKLSQTSFQLIRRFL
jgi:serine/alanine adding enzyme